LIYKYLYYIVYRLYIINNNKRRRDELISEGKREKKDGERGN